MKDNIKITAVGLTVGLTAICLAYFGNPANMAICIACFIRDTAGALGLHHAEQVQYIRPEIIGIVFGAFIVGIIKREHAPKSGSSPFTRFILGICVMVGALVFLGCPMRMVLRIAGGDLNAVVGLAGFSAGILTGIFFLNKGFSLRRSYDQPVAEGAILPVTAAVLLVLLLAAPSFVFFSETGPGSMRAPILLALAGGLIVGIAAQRSRLCFIAGLRDAVLFKDFRMLLCFGMIFATVFAGNIFSGRLNIGFAEQPIAHSEWLWNILGMYLVGLGSVLLGGCPLRQLVMAAGGNGDSGITVLGYFAGAAISHNFAIASSPAGTTVNGRIASIICLIVVFAFALINMKRIPKTEDAAL